MARKGENYMTVKELFDWAVKNAVEDYEIEVQKEDRDDGLIWTNDLDLDIARYTHSILL